MRFTYISSFDSRTGGPGVMVIPVEEDRDSSRNCSTCGVPRTFAFEWYGVNQFGEDPEVVSEMGSCGDFEHVRRAAQEVRDHYGDLPEGVFYEHSKGEGISEDVRDAVLPVLEGRVSKTEAKGIIASIVNSRQKGQGSLF